MKEKRICLHLLGAQPVPVFIGAININVRKHILLATKQTKNVARFLEAELIKTGYEVEIINLEENGDSVITCLDKLIPLYKEILAPVINDHKVFFNVTGGTKLMFAAIFYVINDEIYENIIPFYVETREKKLIYLAGTQAESPIAKLLTIDNFLGLRGYKVNKPKDYSYKLLTPLSIEISNYISNNYFELEDTLTEYKSINGKKGVAMIEKNFPEIFNLMENSKGYDAIIVDKIINGAWLDIYIYTQIKTKTTVIPYDMKIDLSVIQTELGKELLSEEGLVKEQELDLAYTDGYNFYGIECKAGKASKINQEDINKLERALDEIGGSFARGAFVSSGDQSNSAKAQIMISNNVSGFVGVDTVSELVNSIFSLKYGKIINGPKLKRVKINKAKVDKYGIMKMDFS